MNLLLLAFLFSAPPVSYHPASLPVAIDGDTISAEIHLGAGVELASQSIRAANYDAWESRRNRQSRPFNSFSDAQWQAEIAKGLKAKKELIELLDSGQLFVVLRGRDVYGRLLAELYVYRRETDELVDVAKEMKAKGHVRN